MSIIEVNHVTKEYPLGQFQSLTTTALNQWRRLIGQPIEERAPFKALDDVSFSVEQGEVVGIMVPTGPAKPGGVRPYLIRAIDSLEYRYEDIR